MCVRLDQIGAYRTIPHSPAARPRDWFVKGRFQHGSSRPITTSRAQMMIGYSRHSCSLKHRPNEAYLLDHSQFGHGHSSIHLDVARVGGG
jgi:hypothetical protein